VESFFLSTGVVALAEIGDKTQLLALVLAARWRQPLAIAAGILVATLANHAGAAWLGAAVGEWLTGPWMRWIVGASFVAVAAWALVPDSLSTKEKTAAQSRAWGAFLATTVSFFLVEMGDKTQVATVALAAKFQEPVVVAAGTTLGMMLANVPAVLLGDRLLARLPLKAIRFGAAAMFLALGLAVLFGMPLGV
jgi:putative Ca2+/H+ antiporter (TMEM165/GDT1 family)